MTRSPCTFLPINLSSGAIHFRTSLGFVGALPRISHLAHYRLMHQIAINFGFKNGRWEIDAADFLASHTINWYFHDDVS
jgi:hypothetical protein